MSEFRRLDDRLLIKASSATAAPSASQEKPSEDQHPYDFPDLHRTSASSDLSDLVERMRQVVRETAAELMLLRARACEQFEVEVELALGGLVESVLERELVLAPADLLRTVKRTRETLRASLVVRMSPRDTAAFAGTVDAVADQTLESGDLIVETSEGTLDFRVGTRVRALLEERRVRL